MRKLFFLLLRIIKGLTKLLPQINAATKKVQMIKIKGTNDYIYNTIKRMQYIFIVNSQKGKTTAKYTSL